MGVFEVSECLECGSVWSEGMWECGNVEMWECFEFWECGSVWSVGVFEVYECM